MNRFSVLIASLLFFVISGCTPPPEVYANFLVPPNKIENLKNVQNIKINVKNISVSGISKKSKNDIKNMINGKMASLIYNEQFLNVYDEILLKKSKALSVKAKNHHGYKRFYSDKFKFSNLNIKVNIKLKINKGSDTVVTKLSSQTYSMKTDKNGVPSAVPGNITYSSKKTNVSSITYELSGTLDVKLYNSRNKLIYSKIFNDINFHKKIGGDTGIVSEVPMPLDIIADALTPKLREVVFDISPHNESRKLIINEEGNKSIIALMKATAFSDARNSLHKNIESIEQEILKKEKTINQEYLKKIKKAKNNKTKEDLIKTKEEKIHSLYKPLAPDYQNMGILKEILGDLVEANYYYKLSFKYDKSNVKIKESIKKINERIAKLKKMRKMGAKIKSSYKNKDNKDR